MGDVNFEITKLKEANIQKTRGINTDFDKAENCSDYLRQVQVKIESGFETVKNALSKQKEAASDADVIDSDMKTLENSLIKTNDYYAEAASNINSALDSNVDRLKRAVKENEQNVTEINQSVSGGANV